MDREMQKILAITTTFFLWNESCIHRYFSPPHCKIYMFK